MSSFSAVMFMFITIVCFTSSLASAQLSVNYYEHTCPQVESIVAGAVHKATMNDKTVPAAMLRMHFHDCFIRGCDGSVLLESKGKNKAEKDGPPNISLHAFYVIDNAKKALEAICPGIVSCADILALAARDAVTLSGGPTWDVPKGRKDGRISKATETRQLPAPTFNISQLQQSFSQRGLSLEDLVALSGTPLDSSSSTFDNAYYKLILNGKSVFSSDQALLTHPNTKALVSKFADSQKEFERAFVMSMIKMSSIIGTGQEIRLDCKHIR